MGRIFLALSRRLSLRRLAAIYCQVSCHGFPYFSHNVQEIVRLKFHRMTERKLLPATLRRQYSNGPTRAATFRPDPASLKYIISRPELTDSPARADL